MIQLLVDNQILLLAVVAALGYLLGRVEIKGSSLGVAAVLFVGLGIGALDPAIRLPEFIIQLGLLLFVYTIGLSSGPGFFASFRRKGVRDNALVVCLLFGAAALLAGVHVLLGLQPASTAGLFAGSLTNTPALASIMEQIRLSAPDGAAEQLVNEPVIGYSIAYPVGVVGVILAVFVTQRLWKVDYAREASTLRDLGAGDVPLQNRTLRVTHREAARQTVAQLTKSQRWDVLFGRVKRADGSVSLVEGAQRLAPGDLVSIIGSPGELDRVAAYLGEASQERLELDRSTYDFRRIFVSNARVVGIPLRELDLPQQFGAIVTRIRRGDAEWLASGSTVLELGDRVRVVAPPMAMPAVSAFFGDSYRALSEINLLTFNLGLVLGLLLGMVPVPLPGGITFQLGLAGGPLIAGLVLGKLGRTGRLVWYMPYSANLLLRQLGLVLFFAGVGTRAGYAFFSTLTQGGGALFAAGAVVTCGTALAMLWVGYKLLRIPMSLLTGMLAGLQTQPAVLSYAISQSENDLPNIGYATVFPVATITKILLAQLLLTLLP